MKIYLEFVLSISVEAAISNNRNNLTCLRKPDRYDEKINLNYLV